MLKAAPQAKRAAVLHGLGTLLAIALLLFLLSRQGWEEILQALRLITPWRLALAMGLTLVSRVAVAGRWHVLLVSGGVGIPFWQTLRITFAGLFASHFLPTTVGGDVVRLGGVLRLGYARAVSVASLVVDRLVGMAGMAMAMTGLLFQLPDLLRRILQAAFGGGYGSAIFPLLTGGAPAYSLIQDPQPSRLAGIRAKLQRYLQRFWTALLGWRRQPRALLAALAFTWVHMLCLFASISLFLPPLEEQMPFWLIAGLWSLTYFVTLLPISLNGLGVQELSVTFFYTQFGGLQLANALTIALLLRVIQMFASLPGALFIPGLLAGEKPADLG